MQRQQNPVARRVRRNERENNIKEVWAAGLTDDLSDIDTFGRIGFVVNGLLTIVDQPLQEKHQLRQQLLLPMSPDHL
ncbi:hypothetical protein [Fructobacillus americanaquae]|uniref:Uncharacterized protein n=1 Tax=Fructobacillus americanaquae TaxID=2940302 RepID=A0ABY5C2Y8_9LACO|nr:hypothetical protein [Fructobacillus americanaquae]USS92203.1 hypothetical protein M3M36_00895 [Fructobacillus americanaquae]